MSDDNEEYVVKDDTIGREAKRLAKAVRDDLEYQSWLPPTHIEVDCATITDEKLHRLEQELASRAKPDVLVMKNFDALPDEHRQWTFEVMADAFNREWQIKRV